MRGGRGDGEGMGMKKARAARIGLGRGARGTKGAEARSWVGRMSGMGGSACEEDGETDDWWRVR